MYKKLREIFNWFQQKAIRRMSLKNILNEYYYRQQWVANVRNNV